MMITIKLAGKAQLPRLTLIRPNIVRVQPFHVPLSPFPSHSPPRNHPSEIQIGGPGSALNSSVRFGAVLQATAVISIEIPNPETQNPFFLNFAVEFSSESLVNARVKSGESPLPGGRKHYVTPYDK